LNMRVLLHILTRPDDSFAREIIARQQQQSAGENKTVADLTQPQPDYKELLENIFAAESVQVW
jgi:hypothetical protein